MKISATIITFNEEKNIRRAIESVKWTDEIIVVDSESTDKTCKIAECLGAKVITQKWLGFSKQKQFAVDNAKNDWIFSLDADEEVSEKLRDKIKQIRDLPENGRADGYKIPRLSFYMNRPIRHSGWYPDRQLRFFNRNKGKWKDVLIHESFEMFENSKIEVLKEDIYHFSVENAAHHHKMIGERYAPLAAEQLFQRGKTTSPIKIYTAGLTTFFQTYILKRGFLDGLQGFAIARFAAHHAFLKHLLLWEKVQSANNQNKKSKSDD